jgi:probable rRNA maturation factor
VTPVIDISIEAQEWASLENLNEFARITFLAAIQEGGILLAPEAEISILFCNDAFIRKLNQQWRGIDKPTNVLSFPAGGDPASSPLLGDIVIAFETAAKEAAEKGISLRDHVAHLLVHGFLHLIGHDHVKADEAEVMEALERAVLGRLGIPDPYQAPLMEEAASTNE